MSEQSSVRPPRHAGMRHVALFANNFEESLRFYTELLGMEVEWQPDPDNVYLCSGNDNLALHRAQQAPSVAGQRLDHIGFILDHIDHVDEWYDFLVANGVKAQSKPRTHRDGARSFYCLDPDGVTVQMIYHPPISKFQAD